MIPCILESPYAGNVEANLAYARSKVVQLLTMGYSPYASHMLLTQNGILDDNDPEQRALGIAAGLAWKRVLLPGNERAPYVRNIKTVFAAGLGWSPGMLEALDYVRAHDLPHFFLDMERPRP